MPARSSLKLLVFAAALVAAAVAARIAVAEIYRVPSRSMEPALSPGDQVIVVRLHRGDEPRRGEGGVFEGDAGRVWREEAGRFADEVTHDAVGNSYAWLHGPAGSPERKSAVSVHGAVRRHQELNERVHFRCNQPAPRHVNSSRGQSYMLLRYCPPTSNSAFVICPNEQQRTAPISTANTLSSRITASHRRASMAGASATWRGWKPARRCSM